VSVDIPANLHDRQAIDAYFAGSIRRNPNHLKRHLQRIYYYVFECDEKDSDAIFAAVLDLFIVLGDQKPKARGTLLLVLGPYMDSQDLGFFENTLEHGLTAQTIARSCSRSLLTKAYTGRADFIVKAA
jgi:hypothetical protein